MRRTVTHLMWHERKKRGVSPESGDFPVSVHQCVNDHAGIEYHTTGRPRDFKRQYDLDILLKALGTMQHMSPRRAMGHVEHLNTMYTILSKESRMCDTSYQYAVGRRLWAKLLKARKHRNVGH